jgi:signal peptidase I
LDGLLPPPEELDRGDRFARIVIGPLLVLFTAVIIVFYIAFDVTRVKGESMLPNFRPQDRLLITKTYEDPRRGDVVVVRTRDENGNQTDLLKRVVAVPGDTITIENDRAAINGAPERGYLVFTIDGAGDDRTAVELGPGEVFLMGDNRPISFDSRIFGPVKTDSVDGRAVFVFAPIQRTRVVPRGRVDR